MDKTQLETKLKGLINSESRENDSNTPDFLLAEFMVGCLDAFELASNSREVWYGVELEPGKANLSASEAIYGFCAWLTTRKEKTVMSSSDDAAPICDLIKQYCEENKLKEPCENWATNLVRPSGECSGAAL